MGAELKEFYMVLGEYHAVLVAALLSVLGDYLTTSPESGDTFRPVYHP